MLLFNHNPLAIDSSVFQSPSRQTRTTLLKLYQQRVDALLKIVDFSTMNAVIESKYSNASITPQSPALQALEYSMYLTALCSITDDESETMLLGKRQPLIQQYQSAAETWISRAGLLTNPSLTVLQAFILYLVNLRTVLKTQTPLFFKSEPCKESHMCLYQRLIFSCSSQLFVQLQDTLLVGPC